jgi:hypothetical protein
MREEYKKECSAIQEFCTYNAETHHIIAGKNKNLSIRFQVIPAIIAALSGLLVAGNIVPNWFVWLSVLSAVITAVASILNPMKEYFDHLNAAKNFTALKHEARSLCNTFGINMSDEIFYDAVKHLHSRYNDLIKFVPPTDQKSFLIARENIKKGYHVQD